MRAARMHERNGVPVVDVLDAPCIEPGMVGIRVLCAGLQPTDVMRARGLYKVPDLPYILGGEGVGEVDGRRVYFGHSIAASGALAEWTIVPEEEVWGLPAEVDPAHAIALGIAGTGALIPLEEANIQPGEQVLVLGATGPLGQIALQLAYILGAGRVVAAARGRAALERARDRGIADEIVILGEGDDDVALKAGAAGAGYDVVLDCIYGPPAEAAMRATAPGARMMSIGVAAGATVSLSLKDLVQRSHHGVGTGHRPVAERRAAFERLIGWHLDGRVAVDVLRFKLDQVEQAWQAQLGSPGGKVIVEIAS